jgi:very-short-patch-repair endonuclease
MNKYKRFDHKSITEHARELRRSMTDSEKILWEELRGRRLSGYKFLRQYPILYRGNLIRYNYFIADFYCDSKRTIIELDGPVHEGRKEYDEFRDEELKYLGYNILRIKNEEIRDITSALNKIEQFLHNIPES